MAKRGTLDHPKNKRLARALKTFHGITLGLLETIWHQAAQFHADGKMTKLDLEDAFDAGGWLSMFNLEQLIEALSNPDHAWLDVLPDGTFYIHDWHNHCDDSTHAKLYRSLMYFGNGSKPLARKVYGDEKNQLEKQWTDLDIRRTSTGNPPEALPCLALPILAKPERGAEPSSPPQTFDSIPEKLNTNAFREEWQRWEVYQAERHQRKITDDMRRESWARILAMAPPGGESAYAVLTVKHSIAEGWKGIHPKEPRATMAKAATVPPRKIENSTDKRIAAQADGQAMLDDGMALEDVMAQLTTRYGEDAARSAAKVANWKRGAA